MTIGDLLEQLETIASNLPSGYQTDILIQDQNDGYKYYINKVEIDRGTVLIK